MILKYVCQAVPIDDPNQEGGPKKFKAIMRPEMEYHEYKPGVPDGWDGPTGACDNARRRAAPTIEPKTKRVRRRDEENSL